MIDGAGGKIAIIAALPREVAGLVGRAQADPGLKRQGISLYQVGPAVIVCAGMGAQRATLAVEAALAQRQVHTLVSTGLAGACSAAVGAGNVLEASVVIDSTSGERFGTDPPSTAGSDVVLVTSHAIAGVREKQRLHESYRALMVDMEGAAVGRLARAHSLGFRAIKAISDAHDFELSSLSRFASAHGHFRTRAFALHTALRPHTWRHSMKLGAASQRALRNLTTHLQAELTSGGER